MALASTIMLRRASSSLLPRRSLPAATSAALLAVDRSLIPLSRFSTSSSDVASQPANKDLVRMLDLEIKRADKNLNTCIVPPGFPFRIENTEWKDTVILSRRYEDEIIEAEVDMMGSSGETNMIVKISKESGNRELRFHMWGYSDCIKIESLFVKKDVWGSFSDKRNHFDYLDDELYEGFHKYLEMRGINHTNMNLLREKMMMKMDPPDKESMEFKNWLCNLKKFLA